MLGLTEGIEIDATFPIKPIVPRMGVSNIFATATETTPPLEGQLVSPLHDQVAHVLEGAATSIGLAICTEGLASALSDKIWSDVLHYSASARSRFQTTLTIRTG